MSRIFIAVLLVLALGIAFNLGQNSSKPSRNTVNQTTTPSPTLTASPTESETQTGTVTGKLCYPSEILPPGEIQAKNVEDNTIYTQTFAGISFGDTQTKDTYTFKLKPGTYNLRYQTTMGAGAHSYGYHTVECPTAGETTCSRSTRTLIPAKVEAGKTISNFDLCDFYYPPEASPQF